MQQAAPQMIEVRHSSDVGAARRAAKAAAQSLELAPQACEEVALAMSELATNLLKHARAGKLTISPLHAGHRVGLELESADRGPGIPDVEHVVTDGYSTTGSRGTGLGAVNRLMDEFNISSGPEGTRVVCRKWRRAHPVSSRPSPLAFGVATRPCLGYDHNGDAFVIQQWSESALVGVIDGLGHGQGAHQAAETARHYVETHHDLPLTKIFQGVGRACRSTRGVVMALARFDWGQGKLLFASVGDIEARVYPRERRAFLPIQRGILGMHAPTVVVSEQPWAVDQTMVLHSDGLRTHWTLDDFPGLLQQPAPLMATRLLQTLAKDRDDATVVVVRKALA